MTSKLTQNGQNEIYSQRKLSSPYSKNSVCVCPSVPKLSWFLSWNFSDFRYVERGQNSKNTDEAGFLKKIPVWGNLRQNGQKQPKMAQNEDLKKILSLVLAGIALEWKKSFF